MAVLPRVRMALPGLFSEVIGTGLPCAPVPASPAQLTNADEAAVVETAGKTVFGNDHVGLAGWLVRRFDVQLWMTRTDYLLCRNLVADTGQEAPAEGVRFYRAAGFPESAIEDYKTRFGFFGKGVYKLPSAYRRIQEGDRIEVGERVWEVVIGRGHAPEHACLWCREENLFVPSARMVCCR